MSERYSYSTVATGSNTTIKSGYGVLKGIVVNPTANATVHVVDSISIGATPNLMQSQTGEILRLSFTSNADPLQYRFSTGFNVGLTIAATSNTRVHVEYE